MSLIHRRSQAIQTLINEVRATKREEQPESPAFIARIRQALDTLSQQRELFPIASFPIKLDTHAGLYRLGEDSDLQNALYITGGIYGKTQTQPHTHPAWVAMGAVKGLERNRIYQRTDDASVEGQGRLEPLRIDDVVPGQTAFIGSGLFHTLEVEDDIQTLHLHLYDAGPGRRRQRQPAGLRVRGQPELQEHPASRPTQGRGRRAPGHLRRVQRGAGQRPATASDQRRPSRPLAGQPGQPASGQPARLAGQYRGPAGAP